MHPQRLCWLNPPILQMRKLGSGNCTESGWSTSFAPHQLGVLQRALSLSFLISKIGDKSTYVMELRSFWNGVVYSPRKNFEAVTYQEMCTVIVKDTQSENRKNLGELVLKEMLRLFTWNDNRCTGVAKIKRVVLCTFNRVSSGSYISRNGHTLSKSGYQNVLSVRSM